MTRILVILAALFLCACNMGSDNDTAPTDADTGYVTNAQLTAAVAAATAPLAAEIRTLQSSAGGLQVKVRQTAVRTDGILLLPGQHAQTVTSAVGSFVAVNGGEVFGMQTIDMVSPTGYFYCLPMGPGNHSSCLPSTVLYTQPDCQGSPFIIPNYPLSAQNLAQGVVFGLGKDGDTNTADFLMLVAGTAPQPNSAYSEFEAGNVLSCVNISPGPNVFNVTYPLVPNDQNTSGVPSGIVGTDPTIG